jgi:RimJ/RimL family protein N-acetyltransferase
MTHDAEMYEKGREIGYEVGEAYINKGYRQDSGAAYRDHVEEGEEKKHPEFQRGFMEAFSDSGAAFPNVD